MHAGARIDTGWPHVVALVEQLRRKAADMKPSILLIATLLGLTACAGPRPVLYPDAHFQAVGREAAEQDIELCMKKAEEAGATPEQGKAEQVAGSTAIGAGVGAATGAVGGALSGAVGQGSLIGAASGATAGLLQGLLSGPRPSQVYIEFVNRCLIEQGYKPIGWE